MTTTTKRHFILPSLLLLLCHLVTPLLGYTINVDSDDSVQNSFANIRTSKLAMEFEAIYQFGDSLSDTGNLIREATGSTFARLPYGLTFHRPTGRCSDGLLMVDYFAIFFGLPLLNPYLAEGSDFSHGVNFAVAGASALNPTALAAKGISLPLTHSSLDTQLTWFRTYLNSTCSHRQECKQKLQRALVLMGEIGGNDYNFAFSQGRTMQEAYELVPQVVLTIKNAVQEVIDQGAVNVVVPGNFPIGCVPLYLVRYGTRDPSMYDEFQCLKPFNEFSAFHNDRLQDAIKELQQRNPHVSIVYGDYYSALRWVIAHATSLGFERGGWRKACCSAGDNPYNFDLARACGNPGVPVCPDPTKRMSWDGIHMTQQGNKYVSRWLLRQFVPALRRPIRS